MVSYDLFEGSLVSTSTVRESDPSLLQSLSQIVKTRTWSHFPAHSDLMAVGNCPAVWGFESFSQHKWGYPRVHGAVAVPTWAGYTWGVWCSRWRLSHWTQQGKSPAQWPSKKLFIQKQTARLPADCFGRDFTWDCFVNRLKPSAEPWISSPAGSFS